MSPADASPPPPRLIAHGGVAATMIILLSIAWARWVLPDFNSEHLGPDMCHHVVMVQAQTIADPDERAQMLCVFHAYPQASHYVASWVVPLLNDDPYKGVRAGTLICILLILVAHYVLFRTVLPGGPMALLAVGLVQLLTSPTGASCAKLGVGYSYAYIFGAAALWGALVLADWPASSFWQRSVLNGVSIAMAGVAFLGHIVPGTVALGTVGLYGLLQVVRSRGAWGESARLGVLVCIGVAVILGTPQLRYMSQQRVNDGELGLKNEWLLWSWLPILVAGVLFHVRTWRKVDSLSVHERWLEKLYCLLLVAGSLQLYCYLEWHQGKAGAYAYRKFFYLLVPAAMCVLLLGGFSWLRTLKHSPRVMAIFESNQRWLPVLCAIVGVGCLLGTFRGYAANEFRPPHFEGARHPARIAVTLNASNAHTAPAHIAPLRGQPSNVMYFDPEMPQSCVFINMTAMKCSLEDAYRLCGAYQRGWRPGGPPPPGLPHVRTILSPQNAEYSQR